MTPLIRIAAATLATLAALTATSALAESDVTLAGLPPDERETRSLTAGCTTRDTEANDRRHTCLSDPDEAAAPADFYFVEEETVVRRVSGGGGSPECRYEFDGFVEVVPNTGISRPTIARLRAAARSPEGSGAGRGWSRCEGVFVLVRYR